MVRAISSSERTPTEWTAMPGGLFLWLQKTQPEPQREVIGQDVGLHRGVQDQAVDVAGLRDSWRALIST